MLRLVDPCRWPFRMARNVTLYTFRYPARAYSIIQWKLVAGQGYWGSLVGSVGTGHFAIAITMCAISQS